MTQLPSFVDLKLYRVEPSRVGLNVETFNLFYNVLIQKNNRPKELDGYNTKLRRDQTSDQSVRGSWRVSTMETSRWADDFFSPEDAVYNIRCLLFIIYADACEQWSKIYIFDFASCTIW